MEARFRVAQEIARARTLATRSQNLQLEGQMLQREAGAQVATAKLMASRLRKNRNRKRASGRTRTT